MTCCALVVIYRIFLLVLLAVAGGLTYYTYDWQRVTNQTLLDVQKVRAFGGVIGAYGFFTKVVIDVTNEISSFANTLDSISMDVSDPYDVLASISGPVRTSLLSSGLTPAAYLNQRVSYIYNDSSAPRGYLAVGCNLRTTEFPAFVAIFGCSTNTSLTTGSYNTTLYQFNTGGPPSATPLDYNPDGPIDRDEFLARGVLQYVPIRPANVTYMQAVYWVVDYPVANVMRIRDHSFTSETWNSDLISFRGDTDYHFGFVLLLTADNMIVATDYQPYITWREGCEVQYIAEGKDPLGCAKITLPDLPDAMLSSVALRASQLADSNPSYDVTAVMKDATIVTTENLHDPTTSNRATFVFASRSGPGLVKILSVVHSSSLQEREVLMYVALWVPLVLVALGISFVVQFVFVAPITTYGDAMENITHLDLEAVDAKLSDNSFMRRMYLRFREIEKLNSHFTTMNKSMAMFTAYVPKEVVKDMMIADTMGSRDMEVRQVTVMFADIQGFTTICESVDNVDLAPVLDAYFGTLSRILLSHACTIDKFIGDAIMGFWGAPLLHRYQAFSACCASLHMQHAVTSILAPRFQELGFTLVVRIGCHMGYASVGNVGCAERMSYTALGDTVNIASRLEGMNKRYDTRVMVSQSIAYDNDVQNFVFRQLEGVVLKGRTEPMQTFELVGINGEHKEKPLVTAASMDKLLSNDSAFGISAKSIGQAKSLSNRKSSKADSTKRSSKYEGSQASTGGADRESVHISVLDENGVEFEMANSVNPHSDEASSLRRPRSHSGAFSMRSHSRRESSTTFSQKFLVDKVSDMSLQDELESVGRMHILSQRKVHAIHRLNWAMMESEDATTADEYCAAARALETCVTEDTSEFSALGITLDIVHQRIETVKKLSEGSNGKNSLVFVADFK